MSVIKQYNSETNVWETIVVGKQGPAGFTGSAGAGDAVLPVGGQTGQVLKKASNNDYDATWEDESGGSDGTLAELTDVDVAAATSGQILGYTGSNWTALTVSQAARFINLTVSGEITPPRIGQFRFYSPISLTITKIYASISAQAQGGAFTFVLNKNSIDTGAVLSIAEGSFTMAVVSTSITVSNSDYLTLDITGVGSRDLHVKLEYQLEN
jgi:hypothetical protein